MNDTFYAESSSDLLNRYSLRENTSFKEGSVNGDKTFIPEGWSVAKIANSTKFKIGKTPSKTGDNYKGQIPWVTISNLKKRNIDSYTARISADTKAKILPAGTLLGSFKMTVGRFGFTTEPCATNEAIISIVPGASEEVLEYLFHMLPETFKKNAELNGQGVPLLNSKKIKELEYLRPPRQIQKAIASILDFHASGIEKIEQAIDKQEAVLTSLRRSLVSGKLRTKSNGSSISLYENRGWSTSLVNGEKSDVPDEWEITTVNKEFKIVCGTTPSRAVPEYWVNGSQPWITPKDIKIDGDIKIVGGTEAISNIAANKIKKRLVPKGSLVITTRATIGRACLAGCDLFTNQGCHSLVSKGKVTPEYMYYWTLASTDLLKRLSNGTTFLELGTSTLKAIELVVPPQGEQQRIVHVLGTLSQSIRHLRQVKDKETQKFEWLRRQLLSGRLEVVEDSNH